MCTGGPPEGPPEGGGWGGGTEDWLCCSCGGVRYGLALLLTGVWRYGLYPCWGAPCGGLPILGGKVLGGEGWYTFMPICAEDEAPYWPLETAGGKALPTSWVPEGKGRVEGGLENEDCPAAVVSGDWPMFPKGSLLLDA